MARCVVVVLALLALLALALALWCNAMPLRYSTARERECRGQSALCLDGGAEGSPCCCDPTLPFLPLPLPLMFVRFSVTCGLRADPGQCGRAANGGGGWWRYRRRPSPLVPHRALSSLRASSLLSNTPAKPISVKCDKNLLTDPCSATNPRRPPRATKCSDPAMPPLQPASGGFAGAVLPLHSLLLLAARRCLLRCRSFPAARLSTPMPGALQPSPQGGSMLQLLTSLSSNDAMAQSSRCRTLSWRPLNSCRAHNPR